MPQMRFRFGPIRYTHRSGEGQIPKTRFTLRREFEPHKKVIESFQLVEWYLRFPESYVALPTTSNIMRVYGTLLDNEFQHHG